MSSSLKLRKNQTLEAPDLIFEQKISSNAIHEGSTPRASPNRYNSKRGLQARYND